MTPEAKPNFAPQDGTLWHWDGMTSLATRLETTGACSLGGKVAHSPTLPAISGFIFGWFYPFKNVIWGSLPLKLLQL